jgi:hypothetical protein
MYISDFEGSQAPAVLLLEAMDIIRMNLTTLEGLHCSEI